MKPNSICICIATTVFLFSDLVTSYVLPVPGDCTKFQMCDYSGCFVFSCGAGTEFNEKTLVCDYPLQDKASCARNLINTDTRPRGQQGPVGPRGSVGPGVPINPIGGGVPAVPCPGGAACGGSDGRGPGGYGGGQGPIGGGGPIGGYGPTGGYPGGQGPAGGYPGGGAPGNAIPGSGC